MSLPKRVFSKWIQRICVGVTQSLSLGGFHSWSSRLSNVESVSRPQRTVVQRSHRYNCNSHSNWQFMIDKFWVNIEARNSLGEAGCSHNYWQLFQLLLQQLTVHNWQKAISFMSNFESWQWNSYIFYYALQFEVASFKLVTVQSSWQFKAVATLKRLTI